MEQSIWDLFMPLLMELGLLETDFAINRSRLWALIFGALHHHRAAVFSRSAKRLPDRF
jgi:hypothetical protein